MRTAQPEVATLGDARITVSVQDGKLLPTADTGACCSCSCSCSSCGASRPK